MVLWSVKKMRLEIPRQVIDTLVFLVQSLLQCSGHIFVESLCARLMECVSNYIASFSNSFSGFEVLKILSRTSGQLHSAIHNKHKFCQGDACLHDWFIKQWDA